MAVPLRPPGLAHPLLLDGRGLGNWAFQPRGRMLLDARPR
jgi:hypothetical protein